MRNIAIYVGAPQNVPSHLEGGGKMLPALKSPFLHIKDLRPALDHILMVDSCVLYRYVSFWIFSYHHHSRSDIFVASSFPHPIYQDPTRKHQSEQGPPIPMVTTPTRLNFSLNTRFLSLTLFNRAANIAVATATS